MKNAQFYFGAILALSACSIAQGQGQQQGASNPVSPGPTAAQNQEKPPIQSLGQRSIVLIEGDISQPYEILGNVDATVKGKDQEDAVKTAIKEKAVKTYGGQVDAITHYREELRPANLLAGYNLNNGFKWAATGIAIKYSNIAHAATASSYSGSIEPAARSFAANAQCSEGFEKVSESDGRAIFEARCPANNSKVLIECWQGICRKLN
jgi:hypothetical protein